MIVALLAAAGLPALLAAWLLRRERAHWPVIGVLALLAFGFGVAFNGFLPDDSYITYRYAQNLLEGHGFIYNLGERVLSTTTPLYALILAAFGTIWPDLPYTSHALSVAALFGGALLLYLLLYRHKRALPGLFLGALYIVSPLTVAVYSSESLLHVFLIWGAIYAYDAKRLNWALLCAGLAVVNRGDGALVALALGLHWLWVRMRDPELRRELLPQRWPWAALGVFALATVPWYLFSWAYYGSLAPATLSAKMAQKAIPNTTLFWEGLGFWWNSYAAASVFYWLLPPLALLGLLMAFPRGGDRWAAPALLWGALYTAGYSLLQVPRYQNYYTPLVPVLLLLGVNGAYWLGQALGAALEGRPALGRQVAPATVGVLSILLLLAFGQSEANLYPRLPQARAVVYEQIGGWLKENTPADAQVGMLEVGTIGYYADRHIVDFYGLIQPEVSEHLAHNDQTWAVKHYQPQFIVALPWMLGGWAVGDPSIVDWFNANYKPIHEFNYERLSPAPVVIYQKVTP